MGEVVENWNAAVRVSAHHIKLAGAASADRKDIRNLINKICARVSDEFAVLNPTKIQCNIAAFTTMSQSLSDPGRNLHVFPYQGGKLHIWLHADNEMGRLLCELAFGGSGVEHGEDEEQRPATNLEERMAERMLSQIATGIAEIIESMTGFDFERASSNEAAEDGLADQNLQFMEIKVLVNAFTYGLEISIHLLADELAQLMKNNQLPSNEQPIYDVVRNCKFELVTLLPDDNVLLSELLALVPGSILRLTHKVDANVVVRCGEQVLFNGEYDTDVEAPTTQLITLRQLTAIGQDRPDGAHATRE